jgi:hypothetical protein
MSKVYYKNDKTEDKSTKYEINNNNNNKIMEIDSNEIQINVNNNKNTKNKLSLFTKICFASAGLPFQTYSCAISILLSVFLLERAGMKAEKTVYIFFVPRLIDAITVIQYFKLISTHVFESLLYYIYIYI